MSKPHRRDVHASIHFAGAIVDATGAERRELYSDEASWELGAEVLMVALGPQPSSIIATPSASPARAMPVAVAVYRVTQLLASGRAVVLTVPAEQVRCIRRPAELIERRDATGEIVSRDLVTPEQAAAEREQSALVRGGAVEH